LKLEVIATCDAVPGNWSGSLDEVGQEVTSSVFNTVLCEVIARRRDSNQPLRRTRPPTFYWKTSNKVGRLANQ
jgi:hypothetical protein